MKLVLILIATFALTTSKGQTRHPYYGGGHHTTSHGGYYSGGSGSSHRGGHYQNYKTANTYGRHRN